jgi:hypothetical protein
MDLPVVKHETVSPLEPVRYGLLSPSCFRIRSARDTTSGKVLEARYQKPAL